MGLSGGESLTKSLRVSDSTLGWARRSRLTRRPDVACPPRRGETIQGIVPFYYRKKVGDGSYFVVRRAPQEAPPAGPPTKFPAITRAASHDFAQQL